MRKLAMSLKRFIPDSSQLMRMGLLLGVMRGILKYMGIIWTKQENLINQGRFQSTKNIPDDWQKLPIFQRPGATGAVLQTPLWLID